MTTRGRADVWARYWASGATHSCVGSYADNYAGAFAAFWQDAFAQLGAGARVLDLACGNAPLSRLLLSQRADPELRCDAVDLAAVDPPWARNESRLAVHGGVAAEALPFADQTFDLVVSQYGIEYTELSRSLPEVQRVRARSGHVRLVVHHASSLPVALAQEELGHLAAVESEGGLLPATAEMLPYVAQARTAEGRQRLVMDTGADDVRQRFNAAQQAIGLRLSSTTFSPPLLEIRDAVAGLLAALHSDGDIDAAHTRLHALRDAYADSAFRLSELCRHALDGPAAHAMLGQLRRPNDHVELRPLEDAGRVMAWALIIGPT